MNTSFQSSRGSKPGWLLSLGTLAGLIFLPIPARAQLPAGTRDAAAQSQQDPLRTQAAEALQKGDYASAVRLLSELARKNPSDAQVLYNLGSAHDALDQTSEADANYR